MTKAEHNSIRDRHSVCFREITVALLIWLGLAFAAFPARSIAQDEQPRQSVDTRTRPIEKQWKGTFRFPEDGVFFSNRFDGARVSKIEKDTDGRYVVSILPENEPINMSPWYAFKVWSHRKKNIRVRLVYPEFARHRYDPQISYNSRKWKLLDKVLITDEDKGSGTSGPSARPKSVTMWLSVGKDPIWISAQELQSSRTVFGWMDRIAASGRHRTEIIGRSKNGKPLKMLKIGNLSSKKMILVISRQHPPEVTGYFAMQSFIETIVGDSKLARDFRKDWGIYVVPLMNPDGVDAGHWRHNAGGIDLNRDWTTFNQPEGLAVSNFLKRREQATGGKFYFGIDFHSTWNDIYYPMTRKHEGLLPGLVQDWLTNIQAAIPGYTPNIQSNDRPLPAIVSRNYFLTAHQMESIVFEIGDNTPRGFIKKKGKVGAEEIMKLLLERTKDK
jgi:hypothetical protein